MVFAIPKNSCLSQAVPKGQPNKKSIGDSIGDCKLRTKDRQQYAIRREIISLSFWLWLVGIRVWFSLAFVRQRVSMAWDNRQWHENQSMNYSLAMARERYQQRNKDRRQHSLHPDNVKKLFEIFLFVKQTSFDKPYNTKNRYIQWQQQQEIFYEKMFNHQMVSHVLPTRCTFCHRLISLVG